MMHPFRILRAAACALVLTFPISAANQPAPKERQVARTKGTLRNAWPPETLSGKILEVHPEQHLVILQAEGGVPFDMRVTRATRIEAGKTALNLDQLISDTSKNASVRFIPERSGDIASTIRIGG